MKQLILEDLNGMTEADESGMEHANLKRLVMCEQPEHTYVGGYGIGRAGSHKEWTATGSQPTAEDWERWRQGAIKYSRWKKCVDIVQNEAGLWCTVLST